jgi:hypothetical protein
VQLSPFDDYPFHQGFTPLHIPVTSDSHYQDGYYFAFYRPGQHVFMGLRLHPNNNVMDGYCGIVDGDEQHDVRFSRALLPRHSELAVGPFRVEIVEPMVRQRVVLDENPTGLMFDVTLTASCPEFVEHIAPQYRYGRLYNQVIRYSQPSRAEGWMEFGGERVEVGGWHACRDHSWGVRSTFGPYVPLGGIGTGFTDVDRRAIRLWVPFEVEDHAGFFHGHEDADGNVLDFEGRLHFPDGSSAELAAVRHQLRYHSGTTRLSGGDFTLVDVDGNERDYSFEVAAHPAHPQGYGYTRGWSDRGQPGVYRGENVLEHDRFPVNDPARSLGPVHVPEDARLGGTEFASTITGPGGATGMAHVEHMIYGPYHPSGIG